MIKKTAFLSLALIMTLSFALANNAQAFPKNSKGSTLAEETDKMLGLTKEQLDDIEKQAAKYVKEKQELEIQLAGQAAGYKALMKNDNPSPKQASQYASEIKRLEHKLEDLSIKFHMQISKDYNLPMPSYYTNHPYMHHEMKQHGRKMHDKCPYFDKEQTLPEGHPEIN